MPATTINDLTIHYELQGEPGHPPLLLICGLGRQLCEWPAAFIGGLTDAGLHVVLPDNRDAGLSSLMTPPADANPEKPLYDLDHMADDLFGLMDHLDLPRAHVVGVSMGGAIAQHMALARPERLLSLTLMMTHTGDPQLPQPTPAAMEVLLSGPPEVINRETVTERAVKNSAALTGTGFARDESAIRNRAAEAFERSYRPDGVKRQLAAIFASGDRTARLPEIDLPTLVLHGEDDPLVPVESGRQAADLIPGARLEVVPGWGHDMPDDVIPRLTESISRFVL